MTTTAVRELDMLVSTASPQDRDSLVSVYNAAYGPRALFKARFARVAPSDVTSRQQRLVDNYLSSKNVITWKVSLDNVLVAWCFWVRQEPRRVESSEGSVEGKAKTVAAGASSPQFPPGSNIELELEFGKRMKEGACQCVAKQTHYCTSRLPTTRAIDAKLTYYFDCHGRLGLPCC